MKTEGSIKEKEKSEKNFLLIQNGLRKRRGEMTRKGKKSINDEKEGKEN